VFPIKGGHSDFQKALCPPFLSFARASKEAEGNQAPEKQKLVQERESQLSAFGGRFLRLATEHPDEPVAFDALTTVVIERITLDDEVAALGLLVKHHVRDNRLAPLCTTRLRYMSRSPSWPEAESWFRELIEKFPHPEVKANASFSLAMLIEDKAHFAHYLGRIPGRGSYQGFFKAMLGEGGLKRIQGSDPEKLDEEAAHLYQRIIERYPDASDVSGHLAKQTGGNYSRSEISASAKWRRTSSAKTSTASR
jgi:hypothetical protein